MVKITYDDSVKAYQEYLTNRGADEGYALELAKPLNRPIAMDALDAVESNTTFAQRAEFVRKLLLGNLITVTLFDEKVVEFSVTEGFQWFACDELNANPAVLRFIVSVVYGEFLKNLTPRLTASQKAAWDKMRQAKIKTQG